MLFFVVASIAYSFSRCEFAPTLALQRVFHGKRVVILQHEITRSGAPRVCAELASVLHNAGAAVTLAINWGPHSFVTDREILGQTVHNLSPFAGFNIVVGLTPAQATKFDFIIVATASAHQTKWITNFRAENPHFKGLVWWIHESESLMNLLGPRTVSSAVRLLKSGQLDGVIFASWSTYSWWVNAAGNQIAGGMPAMLRVIHWGIPIWRQRESDQLTNIRGSRRAEFGIAANDFVFAVLASFHPLKGHSSVVRALKLCNSFCSRKVKLLMAGENFGTDGNFPQVDDKWAVSDHSIIVKQYSDSLSILSAADAYVSNTKFGGESWGLSTLEALSCKLPVLASGVGGSLEQLQNNVTALIHSVGEGIDEVTELAHHMCDVAIDVDLRSRIGQAGYEFVTSKLDQNHIEKSLVDAFSGLAIHAMDDDGRSPLHRGGAILHE